MEEQEENTSLYYIIGAIALVIVIAVGYFLRPKAAPPAAPVAVVPTPTPSPITQFACENQYYNPVIALPGVYLGAQGGDLNETKMITCTFEVSVSNKVITRENVIATMSASPERGGQAWQCITKALDLQKGVPTRVNVNAINDLKKEASCTADFVFP